MLHTQLLIILPHPIVEQHSAMSLKVSIIEFLVVILIYSPTRRFSSLSTMYLLSPSLPPSMVTEVEMQIISRI